METTMPLNGTEWGLLHQLKYERTELKYKDPETHWEMNADEIAVVREWMRRRIEELEIKRDADTN